MDASCQQHRRSQENLFNMVEYFDMYGFAIFKTECRESVIDERCHDFNSKEESNRNVMKEWKNILQRWDYYQWRPGTKVYSYLSKGVPRNLRPQLWKKLLNVEALKSSSKFDYQEKVAVLREELVALCITEYNTFRAEQELAKVEVDAEDALAMSSPGSRKRNVNEIQNLRQIFLDVGRTFPTHKMFFGDTNEGIEGRAMLFRILATYNIYNPNIGYCQGMSFIAGMLLMMLPEEEAFWCFVALLERPKYLLGYFDHSLERVKCHAAVFERLLQARQPLIWSHLNRLDLDPLIYVTQWFMCMFTSLPCWDSVVALWDLLLFEGVTAIFRVALAIMESNGVLILQEKDANGVIPLLQRLPPSRTHSEVLLPILWHLKVEKWEITAIQAVLEEEEEAKCMRSSNPKRKKTRLDDSESKKVLNSKKKVKKVPYQIINKITSIFSNGALVESPVRCVPDIIVTAPSTERRLKLDAVAEARSSNSRVKVHSSAKKSKAASSADKENRSPVEKCSTVASPRAKLLTSDKRSPLKVISCDVQTSQPLKGFKDEQRRSTHSIDKVDGVVGRSAIQWQSFYEFFTLAPLRPSQRSRIQLRSPSALPSYKSFDSPEVEMRALEKKHHRSKSSPISCKSASPTKSNQNCDGFGIEIEDGLVSPTDSDNPNFTYGDGFVY